MIWGLSLHGWEDLMRGSLLIVGVSGLIAGLSTWFVVKLQRAELAQSATELTQYKIDAAVKVEEAKNEGVAAGKAAGNALVRAAELEKEAASLKLSVAEANKIAEGERLARLKLEREMAWRSLSPEQETQLVEKLKPFAGQPFDLITYIDDPECVKFAAQLLRILLAANWTRDPSNEFLGFTAQFGVVVDVPPAKQADFEPAAVALREALKADGVTADAFLNAEIEKTRPNAIRVRVGKKPERISR